MSDENKYWDKLDEHEKSEILKELLAEGFKPDQPAARVLLGMKVHVALFERIPAQAQAAFDALKPLLDAIPAARSASETLQAALERYKAALSGDEVRGKARVAASLLIASCVILGVLAGGLGVVGWYAWRGYNEPPATAAEMRDMAAAIREANALAKITATTKVPIPELIQFAENMKKYGFKIETLNITKQMTDAGMSLDDVKNIIIFKKNQVDFGELLNCDDGTTGLLKGRKYCQKQFWLEPPKQ